MTDEIFRGSGTSQAAAGAVALMLQHHPDPSPDQVKALLRSTTAQLGGALDLEVGQGLIDVAAAAAAPAPADAEQTWERSTGLGSLEAARGTQHVTPRRFVDRRVLDRRILELTKECRATHHRTRWRVGQLGRPR